jgi:hypothetical protein
VKRRTNAPGIYSPEAVRYRAASVDAIHEVMAKYYQGVEEAQSELLDEAFHPEWLMRDTDTPEAALLGVEGKGAFILRVTKHGPYPGYAEDRVIVSMALGCDHLAYVRVNKDSSLSSTDFFLYRVADRWAIMDKIWMNPRADRPTHPDGTTTLAIVGGVLDRYFAALDQGDRETLTELLHVQWDLKFVERERGLVCLGKEEFLLAVGQGTERESLDHTRRLTVETCQDGMAVVRIDLPAGAGTRFLAILKVGPNWKIVAERRCCSERT